MAGGPTTPNLVVAAATTGSLGFLAAGYKTVEAVEAEIADVRTTGASVGVNLFAPNPVPINSDAFQAYVSELKVESDALGVDLAGVQSREDDDQWADKVALLLDNPAEKFKDEAVVET